MRQTVLQSGMATIIPPDSLLRLKERGRAAGQLTIADLAAELPVDAMDPEELALVIAHLEEAGITVTLDENLLRPAPGGPAPPPPAIELPQRKQDPPAPAVRSAASGSGTGQRPAPVPASGAGPRYANGTVLVAGAIAVVVLLALVWYFGR
jgi:hypothetical protein